MDIVVLGIDLGKNSCSLAGLDASGRVILRRRMRRSPVESFVNGLGHCIVAMEACCGAHHLGRVFAAQGHDTRLMSAEFVRPYVKAQKNEELDAETIAALAGEGVRLIALRSAGYNHVDLHAAERLGLRVARVPAYSPYAVAEHAVCLILALNRKIHRAYARVREGNFSLNGLVGFDLHGKTIGIVGTGKIGAAFAGISRARRDLRASAPRGRGDAGSGGAAGPQRAERRGQGAL